MKYIISESQYELLVESNFYLRIKRRANKDVLEPYITRAEIEFPTLCDDFNDEFEYADNVIRWGLDDFLSENQYSDLQDSGEDYDEVHSYLTDYCKKWFGERLMEIYRNTCSEENGY